MSNLNTELMTALSSPATLHPILYSVQNSFSSTVSSTINQPYLPSLRSGNEPFSNLSLVFLSVPIFRLKIYGMILSSVNRLSNTV